MAHVSCSGSLGRNLMLKAKNQLLVSMAAFVLLAAGSAPARCADVYNGVVEGVVKDASGKPVAGAFVRLKNAEKRLGFMVISQDGGALSAKDRRAANYEVQSVGGDFQSKVSAAVAVPENGAAKVELALTDKRAAD